MASTDLIAKVRFIANKNGLNLDYYTEKKILLREREALREGKTRAEFARELIDEVSETAVNVVVNSVTYVRKRQGYSECPNCGDMTLTHEGGCEICKNCGYSRCG